MYAEVALPLHISQTFSYRIPEEMRQPDLIGSRVVVPFGKDTLTGYIVAVDDSLDPSLAGLKIKDIIQVVDREPIVAGNILELTRWVSEFYFSSWGEAIRAALPAGLSLASDVLFSITPGGREALSRMSPARLKNSTRAQALRLIANKESVSLSALRRKFGKSRARVIVRALQSAGVIDRHVGIGEPHVKPKMMNMVRLQPAGAGAKIAHQSRLTEKQRRVLDLLAEAGEPLAPAYLAHQAHVGPSVIRTLAKRGLLEIYSQQVRRDPLQHIDAHPPPRFELTAHQNAVLRQIEEKLTAGGYAAFLLHGITSSGKTEVYIRAMHATSRMGKTALMLVPEIALTPVLSRRLRSHFGERLAILHSSLSAGERFDEWNRIRRGEAQIVLGTRSAVFAPVYNLGLIVVDEEHDTSYKQDESPRYHGRDTAIMRAYLEDAVVILGSATPSIETFHNARAGKYAYLQLPQRIGGRALASVRVVDLREVFSRQGKQQVFSEELIRALQETYSRGEQSILLLNRRGFSPVVFCRSCGLTVRCMHCDVSLTYHRESDQLRCHYCNYQSSPPKDCGACGGEYIFYVGIGTEQLQARLKKMMPNMVIARMDRDTMRRRGSYERVISEFASGAIHTLVGTQMIAKGHDFPNVTLVGVVSIDSGLGMPDFRSAERSFQLLTQVAGRAGRGGAPGRVLIQTYYPQHYVLQFARDQDYDGFYQREIQFRGMYHYPPFTTLVLALVRHRKLDKVNAIADEFARQLRAAGPGPPEMRILGPAPAPLARLRAEHRRHIILKSQNRAAARRVLDLALGRTRQAGVDTRSIMIDVDPMDMM